MVMTLAVCALSAHAIYVSVTKVVYEQDKQVLRVEVRAFSDDLLAAVRQRFPGTVNITDSLLSIYIPEQFRVKIDGVQVPLKYLQHRTDDDASICILECKSESAPKRLHIANRVLMDAIEDQTNIVRVTVAGQKKILNLTQGSSYDEVEF
ncbi:MAG: DUF6702 family protein [Calditrichia bacterium]